MQTRKLLILLTQYPTRLSRLLCVLGGCNYIHASLGFEEDAGSFYSFGLKGFRTEHVAHALRPGRAPYPCTLYELAVPEATYQRVKTIVYEFERRKAGLYYTRLGAVLALLRLGCRWEKHYFCSQFVAEALRLGEAVRLKKDASLYLPRDLGDLPGIHEAYRGDLLGLTLRFPPRAGCMD